MPTIVKVGKHLIEVPDADPLLRQRIDHGMHGRAVQLIADVLLHKYPGLRVIDASAGTGDCVALVRHSTLVPVLCVEPRSDLFEILRANIVKLGGADALRAHLVAARSTAAPSAGLGAPPIESADTPTLMLDQLIRERADFAAARLLMSSKEDRASAVLRGGWNWLRESRPVLYFAFSPRNRERFCAGEALIRDLAEIGYCRFLLFDDSGDLDYRLDRSLDTLPDALRALRSSVTHGGRLSSYYVLALHEADVDLVQAILAGLDAECTESPAPRIAVVRLDNLDDHVLGSGLFRALHEIYPLARLSLVVPQTVVELYARCPFVDHVIAVPTRETYLRDAQHFSRLIQQLTEFRKFDVVINPRFAEDYYYACAICRAMAAPAAQVVGFRQVFSPLPNVDPNSFYNVLVDASDELHTSRYSSVLLRRLSPGSASAEPELWWAPEDSVAIRGRYHLEPRQYVVVGCGTSFPCKQPSDDFYHHLVRTLTERWGRRVVLIGTNAERPLADSLMAAARDKARIVSTLGQLRLYELNALLRDAQLYVGPDAGPKHMAAAAGIRVIEIGWVPPNHPAKSRGHRTGGKCWAPWSQQAITIGPSSAVFAERIQRPEWERESIGGLSVESLDRALAVMLGT